LQSYSNQPEKARELALLRMATDVEFYAIYYFPHYCQDPFNEFHHDLFQSHGFMERAVRRARAAPRGYAKSTITSLIKPIHDVCYGLEKYIVIVSSTQDQANQRLSDIRTEVLTNAALAADFGIHFRTKKPGETRYTVYRGNFSCLFESYGSGVEVRGIRYGADRPTKIVVDDGEHSEEVDNEALRKKYHDWFFQVISNLGTKTTNIECVGTILHRDSHLANLLKNPAYDGKLYRSVVSWSERQDLWDKWTLIYTNLENPRRQEEAEQFYKQNEKDLLQGAKVLWPEREPYLYLMKELIEKGRRAFLKEKQNEPIGGDEALFDAVRWYRETSEGFVIESSGVLVPWDLLKDAQGKWLNAYGVLDPATGQTKAKPGRLGDFAALLTGIYDPKGRLFVHRDWTKRAPPTKQISEVFEHHVEFGYQKFGVETNLFRNLLLPNLIAERRRIEQETKKLIKIPFYDIENVENKEKRIYTLEPKTTHGWILFNRALSQEFIGQLEAFPHGDHDDGPDALEMLWGLVNNRYKPSALSVDAMGGY
jgi:predicted phage terminase large subunit-like protein